jgi:hypothetical protein
MIKKYEKSYLDSIFYYIYSPALNSLIYYYYNIKINGSLISLKDIINKIYKIKNDSIEYLTYSKNLFYKIKNIIALSSFNVTLHVERVN